MIWAAGAAVVVAVLAWDGWRRKLALELRRTTTVETRVEALEQAVEKLRAEADRNTEVVKRGVEEARQMIAPIRSQLLEAQQRKARV